MTYTHLLKKPDWQLYQSLFLLIFRAGSWPFCIYILYSLHCYSIPFDVFSHWRRARHSFKADLSNGTSHGLEIHSLLNGNSCRCSQQRRATSISSAWSISSARRISSITRQRIPGESMDSGNSILSCVVSVLEPRCHYTGAVRSKRLRLPIHDQLQSDQLRGKNPSKDGGRG
jgi:hypothetical protein